MFQQAKGEFVGVLIRRKILSDQVVAITHQDLKLEERGTAIIHHSLYLELGVLNSENSFCSPSMFRD